MKKQFLVFATRLIRENNPNITEGKMEELRYGLEGFYLTVSKLIVIIPLSFLFHIFKEMIILMVFFNLIRKYAFGLHATKSWICLLSSAFVFLGVPLLAKYLVLPFFIKVILGIISILLIFIYAPADTKKRPLIRRKKREKLKFLSTIVCSFLVILSLIITNETVSNLIIGSIWIEIVLIAPITYKIFHLSYNNYKDYHLQLD